VVVRRERLAGYHEGVSGAALFGLQNEVDASGSDGGADTVGFMTDYDEDVRSGNDPGGGGDDVREERLASDFMQYLG
jgi:hypothetical protein